MSRDVLIKPMKPTACQIEKQITPRALGRFPYNWEDSQWWAGKGQLISLRSPSGWSLPENLVSEPAEMTGIIAAGMTGQQSLSSSDLPCMCWTGAPVSLGAGGKESISVKHCECRLPPRLGMRKEQRGNLHRWIWVRNVTRWSTRSHETFES